MGFGQAWGEDGDAASGGEREIKGGRVEEGDLQERKKGGWAEGAVLSKGRLELKWAPLS